MNKFLNLQKTTKGLLGISVIVLLTGCSQKSTVIGEHTVQKDKGVILKTKDNKVNSTDKNSIISNEQNKIYFDFDKYNIRKDMYSLLDSNLKYLEENPLSNIGIQGNADERGNGEYNYDLSLKRAKAVKDYFIFDGVDTKRITLISLGETTQLVLNKKKVVGGKIEDLKLLLKNSKIFYL